MRTEFLELEPRPGMTQRFVSEREMESYIDCGWNRRQASNEPGKKKIRDTFNDEVADKMYLMEIPQETYQKEFVPKHMGLNKTRLQEATIRQEKEESQRFERGQLPSRKESIR